MGGEEVRECYEGCYESGGGGGWKCRMVRVSKS